MTLEIPDYHILQTLYESGQSLVYRGQRKIDQHPVILKILKAVHPTAAEVARFKHEYDILTNLNVPGAVKAYALKTEQNRLIMVLEDFGGESVAQLLRVRKLDLSEFLDLAIKISIALGQIHQNQIIHKDINPANIVWNQKTKSR